MKESWKGESRKGEEKNQSRDQNLNEGMRDGYISEKKRQDDC